MAFSKNRMPRVQSMIPIFLFIGISVFGLSHFYFGLVGLDPESSSNPAKHVVICGKPELEYDM